MTEYIHWHWLGTCRISQLHQLMSLDHAEFSHPNNRDFTSRKIGSYAYPPKERTWHWPEDTCITWRGTTIENYAPAVRRNAEAAYEAKRKPERPATRASRAVGFRPTHCIRWGCLAPLDQNGRTPKLFCTPCRTMRAKISRAGGITNIPKEHYIELYKGPIVPPVHD